MNCVTSKKFYAEHVPKGVPIFYQPFYLDVVTEGEWEATCLLENDKILAIMPYSLRHCKQALIQQPAFTIYLGPFFPDHQRSNLALGKEMEILEALESSIKKHDYYNQNWHPSSRNWMPFYWKGYHQSTRYSYVISGPREMQHVREGYNQNVRRNLKRSGAIIWVEQTTHTNELFSVICKTFKRKGMQQPYNFQMFKELVRRCVEEQCCSIMLAKDADANIHAAMFLVWDDKWVYYMAGGVDDKYKTSGAVTLLFDKAIQFAMDTGRSFDFEGSMIRSVEKYFRSFGAVQQEYFVLTKVNSGILRIRLALARIHQVFSPF